MVTRMTRMTLCIYAGDGDGDYSDDYIYIGDGDSDD